MASNGADARRLAVSGGVASSISTSTRLGFARKMVARISFAPIVAIWRVSDKLIWVLERDANFVNSTLGDISRMQISQSDGLEPRVWTVFMGAPLSKKIKKGLSAQESPQVYGLLVTNGHF